MRLVGFSSLNKAVAFEEWHVGGIAGCCRGCQLAPVPGAEWEGRFLSLALQAVLYREQSGLGLEGGRPLSGTNEGSDSQLPHLLGEGFPGKGKGKSSPG